MASPIMDLSNLLGWSPLIQSVLMFLTVCVSAWAVYLSIQHRNEDRESAVQAVENAADQAKKRAIIDLLIAQKTDPNYIRDAKIVRGMKDSKECLSSVIDGSDMTKKDAVLSVLNQLEFIAVGIRLNVFDEYLYKQLSCSSVIKTWDAASGFVYELRQQTGIRTLYQDLEYLVDNWRRDPIKSIRN